MDLRSPPVSFRLAWISGPVLMRAAMAVTDSPSALALTGCQARLGEYRGVAGHWDEAIAADGSIRPHWQPLFADPLTQSKQAAQDRHDLCGRLLKEYGVTYNLPGGKEPEQRPWQLDSWPLLISAEEWSSLRVGVAQRAQLLNQILADIYGPRRLLESGDLPPEIVLANPAFLRAATHVVPAQNSYLTLYAVDVARSPNGRWWVVGDRADTPAGMGYALENRIVLSRVYPDLIQDLRVTRLARFFSGLRDRLLALAPPRGDEPRIVILTPGPFHPTHFEQVYLARYLGFSLVEGEDLTVRDRGVFLKTLSGLLPVDVILRCVRSDYCDPLELRDDSLLGVAGLLQAARAGKVVLANAIGTGAVETPALLPFLPGLCRRLLGEELLLPPVATWWCGQPEALATVLAGLDRLVIKHAFPARETEALLPGKHLPAERRSMILANPHLYVGQEFVSLSTAPTWQNQQLQPRHLMLRLYAAATGNGQYVVMPGALARAGNSPDSIIMSSETGGGSKDTWVLGDSPPDTTTLLPTGGRSSALSRAGFILPSRLADNLFWLGRYLERIEFGCRLARCVLHRLTDQTQQGQLSGLSFLLTALTAHGRIKIQTEDDEEVAEVSADPLEDAIRTAVFDPKNPRSIAADISRVERISTAVRDRLSHDAWRIVRALADSFPAIHDLSSASCEDQLAALDDVLLLLLSFSGQTMDGMTRDNGWRFLDLGRRLERAANLCDLVFHAMVDPAGEEAARLPVLLEIANSAMTYRSRYVFGPDPAPVLDLLLADESNPRSVAFQLSSLYQHLRSLRLDNETSHGDTARKGKEQRIVHAIFSRMRLIDVDALAVLKRGGRRVRLAVLLRRITHAMEDLSRALTRSYLTHAQSVRPLRGPAE
jgi:uncharacterized circularly permuted ATP-grasp superfamily protein/uncharacterized alpha-E superfamily protein